MSTLIKARIDGAYWYIYTPKAILKNFFFSLFLFKAEIIVETGAEIPRHGKSDDEIRRGSLDWTPQFETTAPSRNDRHVSVSECD